MKSTTLLTLRIALFAPTFRGDYEIADEQLDSEIISDCLHERFGGSWILLKGKSCENILKDYKSWYPI